MIIYCWVSNFMFFQLIYTLIINISMHVYVLLILSFYKYWIYVKALVMWTVVNTCLKFEWYRYCVNSLILFILYTDLKGWISYIWVELILESEEADVSMNTGGWDRRLIEQLLMIRTEKQFVHHSWSCALIKYVKYGIKKLTSSHVDDLMWF